jgi:uncharacterized protein (DUF58 family)
VLASAAPTGRAAAAIAVAALCALVVPAWLAVAAVIVIAAAVAADAWEVREAPRVRRTVASVLSRGARAPLQVSASYPGRRTVLLRQPAGDGIEVRDGEGAGELNGSLLPVARGRFELAGVASASIGPLGLARVAHPPGPAESVRVYPDLVTALALIARLRSRTMAGLAGRSARGPLGLGTDFESIREYSPDDDIRQLNWRASARMGRPMSNQYRIERDRDVVCLLDTGRLMAAPLGAGAGVGADPAGGWTMLDAALDAITVVALATDELGDRCGVIAFDDRIRSFVTPQHRSGRRVIEAVFELQPALVDSDFELAFLRVGRSRRALVLVFTDLVDEAAASSLLAAMPMLARRHAVSVLSAADPALAQLAAQPPETPFAAASVIVAADVLQARAQAAARLRRLGASVLEAPAETLAARCLDVYLSAKSRARL